MTGLRIPVEFDVADMPDPPELQGSRKLADERLAAQTSANEKRFMAVPARKLTTYEQALKKARNMVEHNGMTVRVMEVRDTIYAEPKAKGAGNG